MVLLGAGIILLPDMPLIRIMFYSQVINGAILPVILVFMLLLVNDRRIMGKYTNGTVMNILSWLTVAVLTFLSLAMLVFALI
jgi:Mn2+/Fe2+ NRAMP family transporter